MTTITKRVTGSKTRDNTKRLDFSGHGSIYDAWGNSFGNPSAWGSAWLVHLALSEIGHTARVINPSSSQLLLEGSSDELLLEGGMQDNGDVLILEGDERAIDDNSTKRVTGL